MAAIMVNETKPVKKITSAIFSYSSCFLCARIDMYDNTLAQRNKTIDIPINLSTTIVSTLPTFHIFIKLSIMKHIPSRLLAVGNICLEISLLFCADIKILLLPEMRMLFSEITVIALCDDRNGCGWRLRKIGVFSFLACKDFNKLAEVVRDITRLAYEEVNLHS